LVPGYWSNDPDSRTGSPGRWPVSLRLILARGQVPLPQKPYRPPLIAIESLQNAVLPAMNDTKGSLYSSEKELRTFFPDY
jgi:hypothetical protein